MNIKNIVQYYYSIIDKPKIYKTIFKQWSDRLSFKLIIGSFNYLTNLEVVFDKKIYLIYLRFSEYRRLPNEFYELDKYLKSNEMEKLREYYIDLILLNVI